MKISTKIIKELNPCCERFDNYLEYYRNFEGDLNEFLALDKITYQDKIWVFTRLATKEQNIKWSILCAESVLHIFDDKHPNDKRPSLAIQAAKNYLLAPTEENKAAADAAAYAAADAADAAAVYAAYAAASAADAAYAANAAAAYAAAAYAVDVHTDTATKVKQQNLNLQLMLEVVC